jgi:hypothetical protein
MANLDQLFRRLDEQNLARARAGDSSAIAELGGQRRYEELLKKAKKKRAKANKELRYEERVAESKRKAEEEMRRMIGEPVKEQKTAPQAEMKASGPKQLKTEEEEEEPDMSYITASWEVFVKSLPSTSIIKVTANTITFGALTMPNTRFTQHMARKIQQGTWNHNNCDRADLRYHYYSYDVEMPVPEAKVKRYASATKDKDYPHSFFYKPCRLTDQELYIFAMVLGVEFTEYKSHFHGNQFRAAGTDASYELASRGNPKCTLEEWKYLGSKTQEELAVNLFKHMKELNPEIKFDSVDELAFKRALTIQKMDMSNRTILCRSAFDIIKKKIELQFVREHFERGMVRTSQAYNAIKCEIEDMMK